MPTKLVHGDVIGCEKPQPPLGSDETPDDDSEDGFPPSDKGIGAYKFLFAAFCIELLLWGFPNTFGVFQNYYTVHPPLEGNKNIPWIGVLSTGVFFIGSPFSSYLSRRYPRFWTVSIIAGLAISTGALVAASFCQSLVGLALTQGALFGLGFLITCYPILTMLDEWWITRRGFAYGVLFGASGLSGVALPFITEVALQRYGFKTTLRGFAIAICVIPGPATLLLKPRFPVSSPLRRNCTQNQQAAASSAPDEAYRRPTMYILLLTNLFQGLGFYLPFIYLPSFAHGLGYSSTKGALLLALANAAQVVGQYGFGHFSDTVDVHVLLFVSSAVSAISVLSLWGLAKSLASLIVFSVLYGGFAGGFVTLWIRMSTCCTENEAVVKTIFSLLAFEKGVGNIISGPVSAALKANMFNEQKYGLGEYKWIVIFTGVCMAVSSLGVVGRFVRIKGLPR